MRKLTMRAVAAERQPFRRGGRSGRLRASVGAAVLISLGLPVFQGIASASVPVITSPSKAVQAKFIKAVHTWVPSTKHEKNHYLFTTGEAICHNLGLYPQDPGVVDGDIGGIPTVLGTFQDENTRDENNQGVTPFTKAQVADIFGMSVLFLCPRYGLGVQQFNQAEGGTQAASVGDWVPTTKTPPLPQPPSQPPASESEPSGACDPQMTCTSGAGYQPTAKQNAVFAKDAKIVPTLGTFDGTGSEYEVTFMSDAVCEELGQGFDPGPIDSVLLENLPAPLSNRAATTIIMVATVNFCPQYAGVVDRWYKATPGNHNPKDAFSAGAGSAIPATFPPAPAALVQTYNAYAASEGATYAPSELAITAYVDPKHKSWALFRVGPAPGYETQVQAGEGIAVLVGGKWKIVNGVASAQLGCATPTQIPANIRADFHIVCDGKYYDQTTTTISSPPVARATSDSDPLPGIGTAWQPAPQALVNAIDSSAANDPNGSFTFPVGATMWTSQDPNEPQWYYVDVFISPSATANGDDNSGVEENVDGKWKMVSAVGSQAPGCYGPEYQDLPAGISYVPSNVLADFGLSC